MPESRTPDAPASWRRYKLPSGRTLHVAVTRDPAPENAPEIAAGESVEIPLDEGESVTVDDAETKEGES